MWFVFWAVKLIKRRVFDGSDRCMFAQKKPGISIRFAHLLMHQFQMTVDKRTCCVLLLFLFVWSVFKHVHPCITSAPALSLINVDFPSDLTVLMHYCSRFHRRFSTVLSFPIFPSGSPFGLFRALVCFSSLDDWVSPDTILFQIILC